MTSTSDAVGRAPSVAAGSPAAGVRPFFWSVRRELWEHRSIYAAPAIVGAVVVAGVLIAALRSPPLRTGGVSLRSGAAYLHYQGPPAVGAALLLPLLVAAAAIILVGALTGIFYCLSALNGERRDRSILFWKSLPVSNVTAVASKVFAPMAILPLCVFAAVVVTHLAILGILAASLAVHGQGFAALAYLPLLRMWSLLAWLLVASSLWWAPVYGWALLASAWAKRMTLLWAMLPPIGLAVFERVAFDTRHVEGIIHNRLNGSLTVAFKAPSELLRPAPSDLILPDPNPVGFFTSPGLWIGLAFAALCFAGAVWLRRRAEPV
jgi:ABC-2 type transport system permease protein